MRPKVTIRTKEKTFSNNDDSKVSLTEKGSVRGTDLYPSGELETTRRKRTWVFQNQGSELKSFGSTRRKGGDKEVTCEDETFSLYGPSFPYYWTRSDTRLSKRSN